MKVDTNTQLFGLPILKIREIIRQAMQERLFGQSKTELYKKVAVILSQSESVVKNVMMQMVKEDYLVFEKKDIGSTPEYYLTPTLKGRQLGIAKAIPPITREKANQLLNELIERAKAINSNKELVYYVECLKVFGSYLSDKVELNDLDIGFKLIPRSKGEEFTRHNQKRIKLAYKAGRTFSGIVDELMWPYKEIVMLLKSKQKSLSLHNIDSDQIFEMTESKMVYQFDLPELKIKKGKKKLI